MTDKPVRNKETRKSEGETDRRAGRRGPRKATAKYLENSALFYLQRYASSAANLERVLLRKVERSAKAHDTDPVEGRRHVRDIIAKLHRNGLLDDRLYAESRARSLNRRGASGRMVRMKLAREGVEDDHIDHAFEELREDYAEPDLAAALNYARRRRIGPYRTDPRTRQDNRERDLAALGRQGFSLDLALKVVEIADEAELSELENEALGPAGRP
jgi:regulatory protein